MQAIITRSTTDISRMVEKLKDEYDAMMICREKVVQRGLPMQIVDAEYQWDRRKLTFYFKAEKRVDFRELTKENFRIFKVSLLPSRLADVSPVSGCRWCRRTTLGVDLPRRARRQVPPATRCPSERRVTLYHRHRPKTFRLLYFLPNVAVAGSAGYRFVFSA